MKDIKFRGIFVFAGISTFFAGVADRKVLSEKSLWLATGWGIAKKRKPRKFRKWVGYNLVYCP